MRRIKFMRQNAGLTQNELGKIVGLNYRDISAAELYGPNRLRPWQMEAIANALDWGGDPMELFEEIEDTKRNLYRNEEE